MNAPNPKESPRSDRGIRCPKCGCGHWRVIYTRASWQGALRRRRECRNCGARQTTVEMAIGSASNVRKEAAPLRADP